MNNFLRKTCLITGASSGIGKELAILFAKNGYNLILIARNQEALELLAQDLQFRFNVQSDIIAVDLSKQEAYSVIEDKLCNQSIDVLVNNAGVCSFGSFIEQSLESQLNIITLNITALTRLTHLVLPRMVKQREGHILNIASVSAFFPFPNIAVYSATKAYVLSFSQGISVELAKTGVNVTAVCLGITKTPLLEKANVSDKTVRLYLLPQMDSQQAAQIALKAMLLNKRVFIGDIKNQLLVFTLSILTRIGGLSLLRFIKIQ